MRLDRQTKEFIKEEALALKNKEKEDAIALKNKENGKSYSISDFTFAFKSIPAYKEDFKEVEVKFTYKEDTIIYYCFVNVNFTQEEALDAAKDQIQQMIDNGAITYYAKLYYKKIHA